MMVQPVYFFFFNLGYRKGWNRRWSGGVCLGECWLLTGTTFFSFSFSFFSVSSPFSSRGLWSVGVCKGWWG